MESATTNCTLGLNSRQHLEGGPTLGLCIHADMSPIKISLHELQISLIVDLAREVINFASKICPGKEKFEISFVSSSCVVSSPVKVNHFALFHSLFTSSHYKICYLLEVFMKTEAFLQISSFQTIMNMVMKP